MKSIKAYYCFNIKNIHQALEIILICKNYNIIPIFFIKFYIINGFGPDWITEFRNLLLKKFNKKDYKIFIDCKKNYGLFINLVQQKIDYLKIEGDKKTLIRLDQIAQKNKISLNPKFDIIDLTKIKNIELKINKHLTKKINE